MMEFYVYRPDANVFAGIGIDSAEDVNVGDIHFSDLALAETWKPVRFHGFVDNPAREGDFPSLADYNELPVVSQRAWDVLQPLIGCCCEPLPIIHPSGNAYYIVHVLETVDCLDPDRSKVRRSRIGGRISRIFEYSLKGACLQDKHIFKLPLECGGELLIDDVFRRIVEANDLKGLQFRPIPCQVV